MRSPSACDKAIPLSVKSPSVFLRAILLGEVLLFVGAAMMYLWWYLPSGEATRTGGVVFCILLGAWPIALNLLHGDGLREAGLRVDNLASSSRQAALVVLVVGLGVLGVGVATEGLHWFGWSQLIAKAGKYAVWGLVQQYLLQSFALRRMRQARLPAAWACASAAGLFAFLHAPNWMLVGLTAAMGMVWCALFLRRANLLPLGLAHALLAMLVYYAWPESWHAGLTIGPMYLQQAAGGLGP
ncbi:MAG TPA: hypothetical protein PK082_00605 [Phycisphaerae bacterium]|nr:hypothetical protein [Phycisphaerae bacterium]